MRSMSFAMTKSQLLDGSKDVTRRKGWKYLKAGDKVKAVNKSMGLKRGEKQKVYGTCLIISARRERLNRITAEDVAREGYPGKSPNWFVTKFCKAMSVNPWDEVTRIEFKFTEVS